MTFMGGFRISKSKHLVHTQLCTCVSDLDLDHVKTMYTLVLLKLKTKLRSEMRSRPMSLVSPLFKIA